MKFDLLIIITIELLQKYKTNLYVLKELVPFDEMVLVGDCKVKEIMDADEDLQIIGCRFVEYNDLSVECNEDTVIPSYGAKTDKNYLYWDIRYVPTKVFSAFEDERIYFDDDNGEELSHLMISVNVMHEALESDCSLEEAFDRYWAILANKYPDLYVQRECRVFENAGAFIKMEELSDNDLSWLSVDYDMLRFGEEDKLLPEYSSFFYNDDYRNRLRASQICEVIQDDMNSNLSVENKKEEKLVSLQGDLLYDTIKNQLLSDVDFVGELSDKLLKVVSIFGPHNRVHLSPLCEMQNAMFNTMSGEIYVGDHTFCGSNVSIITGSHDVAARGKQRMEFTTKGNDIEIKNGVWLCSNAVILGPCTIHNNAVVAAGSVVLPGTVIGENELWAGVPAEYKKKI